MYDLDQPNVIGELASETACERTDPFPDFVVYLTVAECAEATMHRLANDTIRGD